MTRSKRKYLQVLIEDTDTWEGSPLHEAIVRMLKKAGVAGATVWSGIMGYGESRRVHRTGLFGDQTPVIISVIDSEQKIRAILPQLLTMVQEGRVVLFDAEVFVKCAEEPSSHSLSALKAG
jgi:PII-like signaling protein